MFLFEKLSTTDIKSVEYPKNKDLFMLDKITNSNNCQTMKLNLLKYNNYFLQQSKKLDALNYYQKTCLLENVI
jgi:hypothetical protein